MNSRGRRPDPEATIPRLAPGVECERVGDVVRLRGPVERRSAPGRAFAWLMRVPSRPHVELDDIGTWVIGRCDGRSVDDLADQLAAHLKLSRREAETALADFFSMLLRRRLVVLDAAGAGAAA